MSSNDDVKETPLNEQGNIRQKREASPDDDNQPVKKQLKLAISKDPPTSSSKAVDDPNFFRGLKGTMRRPIYHVENTPEKINHSSSTSTTSAANTPAKSKIAKKVRFKENLVEIREYERNPEEWTSFDEGYRPPYYETTWYTPFEIKLVPKSSKRDLDGVVIRSAIDTPEVKAQEKREKLALAATYISPQHIPPSPAEPDEIPVVNADGSIPIIPLTSDATKEVETTVTLSSTAPVINPNMITPENLAIAAAILKTPTQQHQTYNAPVTTASINATSSFYNPPSYTPPSYNRPPVATPSPPSNASQQQISNQDVEALLRNNPDIMQSLKQLSQSAANILDVQAQPARNQSQQQYPSQQQYQPQQRQYQAQAQQQYSSPQQKRKQRATCTFFQNGNCLKGANCKFSHNL